MRDGRQVQRSIGRPAGGGNDSRGVFQRASGDDVARPDIGCDQLQDLLAGSGAKRVADFVRCWRPGRIRQRQTDRLGYRRHGVGGELCTACPCRGAGHPLDFIEVSVRYFADRMTAYGLEHVLHCDLLATESARQDRAAIDEDRRHVEPDHRHHHARQRLVAAGKPDEGVIGMAADGQLDRVGDAFARRQRRAHAVMAHGDAVGDGDGAEFARGAAGGRNALFHGLRLAH